MAYTVAITNQKGGVGKTTTAVNLAAALAIADRRTLLVDADPQGNTTSGVGIAKLELQVSLYDVLVDDHPVHDVILQVPGLRHLSLLPATQDLVGAELQLVERPFRESALRRVLEPLAPEYDYIVVDCPPSLGLLTLNVLAAVQQLIIPIQCEYYGLEGISQLLNTVRLVQQNINPGLAIGGVLLTMYDSRLNLCRQVAEDATEYFGPKVFGTPIPRNVRLAEAPSFGKPILLYDVQSVGAKSYLAVAQELLRRVEGNDVTIAPAQVAAATAEAASAEVSADGERMARGAGMEAADASTEAAAAEATMADRDPVEAQSAEMRTAEAEPAQPTWVEPQTPEPQTLEPQPAEGQTADSGTGETRTEESMGAEAAEARPTEITRANASAEESQPDEMRPIPPQPEATAWIPADSNAAEPNETPPDADGAEHAGAAQELDDDESTATSRPPDEIPQADQGAPVAAATAPLAGPEAAAPEESSDDASRRSSNSAESRPEVTT